MKKILLFIFVPFIFESCTTIPSEEKNIDQNAPLSNLYDPKLKPFYHGVASGDPLTDAVIIWTRIHAESDNITVTWQVAEDENFNSVVIAGENIAKPASDYTIKVDVKGLQPGKQYFYRFKSGDNYSPVGRTRTLPSGATEEVKFAVVSCSNWEFGYFNAYKQIAEKELDAVIHLGDYIYEYGIGTYGDTSLGKLHVPPYEIISLDDYRTRYSQYRLDPDLRKIHQMHPFISIWDDHEIANNAYETGAQNHQPNEGSFEERKEAARQAYYEWMPVRDNQEHYRSFQYGELAQLIMLDERLAGRTEPAADTTSIATLPPDHTMLGKQQLSWFKDQLKKNNERWQIIGNQVVFSYLNYGTKDQNLNPDSWDGYPMERKEIVNLLAQEKIDNVIFLTGDTHASWAFEVTPNPFIKYDSATGIGAVAVEFGTPSVNSANVDEKYPTDSVKLHEQTVIKPLNPHLKYLNLRDHGYLMITLKAEEAIAQWFFINSVKEKTSEEFLGKTIRLDHGKHKLKAGD